MLIISLWLQEMTFDIFSVLFLFVDLFLEILDDEGKLVDFLWFFLAFKFELVSDSEEFSLINVSSQLLRRSLPIKRCAKFGSEFLMWIIESFNKVIFFEHLNLKSLDLDFEGFQLMCNLGELGLVEVFDILLLGFELFDFAFLLVELAGDNFHLLGVLLFELWKVWVDFLRLKLKFVMGLIEGFNLSVKCDVLLFELVDDNIELISLLLESMWLTVFLFIYLIYLYIHCIKLSLFSF